MSRILIPLDGSQSALAAIPAAATLGDELILVPIDERWYTGDELPEPAFILPTEQVARVRLNLQARGFHVRARADSISAEQLPEEAARCGASRIVMSCHGRPGFGRWQSSGAIERIRARARCPVTVIDPDRALRRKAG